MFAIRDSGDIFSFLDHPDVVASIRNPSVKEMTEIDITTHCLLPLAVNTASILHDHQVLDFPYNPVLAFTALVMWLQLYTRKYNIGVNFPKSVDCIYEITNEESRTAAHKYRAELVVEYEALEKPFDSKRGNPRYIYYIPDPDVIDIWLKETEKIEKQKKSLKENSFYSKKYRPKQNGSTSTMDLDSYGILFFDEEIFPLKFVTSKLNKKSQRNRKTNNKNVSYNTKSNKSGNESSSKDHSGSTTNVDDQLSMQERLA
ncbi:7998_t:CDS:2 [Diversispora eburnea]|uniref:7998_t:CDS:1 n=1 Tax=Diversispora eburnea TaxID=1213867 RepID=A0A9N8YYT6_9GLOM|nr:7998_t:CDS:2 [Diversispora eburnea]